MRNVHATHNLRSHYVFSLIVNESLQTLSTESYLALLRPTQFTRNRIGCS
jgi:hypothetical protein